MLLAVAPFAGTAQADLMSVQGSTAGAFYNAASGGQLVQVGQLSFSGTSFGPITSDTLTLGSFSFSPGPFDYPIDHTFDYTNQTFDLTVTFTLAGVSGSPIAGDLTGTIRRDGGTTTITFGGPVLFTFPGGSFDLTAASLTLTDGPGGVTSNVTGTLSNEELDPVPEPASVALAGTGIGVLAFVRRKRRIRG